MTNYAVCHNIDSRNFRYMLNGSLLSFSSHRQNRPKYVGKQSYFVFTVAVLHVSA